MDTVLAASAVPVRSSEVSLVKPPGAMVPVMGKALSVIEVIEGASGGMASTVAIYPVKATLFKSTLAFPEPEFAVVMSSLPSPFRSPKATAIGPSPTAKVA